LTQTLNLRTENEAKRWYKLKEHPVQLALVHDDVRFKLAPCGRRSGKTERAKRFMAKTCMREPNSLFFIAAPTHAQVKKMYWKDMKKLCFTSLLERKPSETEMIIYFNNGTELHLIGLDKPERMEGTAWDGGIIDEIANIKATAWAENIKPALDTMRADKPGYKAWCWLIGVPEGLNHYYDLCEYARTSGDPDWKLYHWISADILPEDTIASAKRTMSLKQYKQEYEGSFETASGRIYEDYDNKNTCSEVIQTHETILYFCDFNFTPMSHGIGVRRDNNIYCLDEVILESAVAEQNMLEFVNKYENHQNKHVILYGDPSGRNGEKHGHESDYVAMQDVLTRHGWRWERRVANSHPSIRDRQNAVRAKICNAADERTLFVNPSTAPWCHKALSTVCVKEGSAFLEDDKNPYQHISTAIGYMVHYEWPIVREETDLDLEISY